MSSEGRGKERTNSVRSLATNRHQHPYLFPSPAMPTSTRRISYVVPFPSTVPPWLQLPSAIHPRNGSPLPLLLPSDHPPASSHASLDPPSAHPQHSLGVPALALDTSTQLAGKDAPQGILLSGGRDGLIASWELGFKLKKRTVRQGYENGGKADWVRWNELGVDGGDENDDEDADLGANVDSLGASVDKIPYEDRWEVEPPQQGAAAPSATFRQSCQFHTDWVNDIVLTNLNRTVISASSDRTIRAWSPHSPDSSTSSVVIGTHHDFVRCLAHSRHQSWVASGGFDRNIKLWDIASPSSYTTSGTHPVPLLVLNQSEERTEKSSIYSLATNLAGSMVASGSPEQTINVWDPRMGGAKRIAKMVGHTDNIRSILLSEDGRFMLSGSADTTVKLWSMSAQRVIHTFDHHEDSVWSLFSSHPNLERFYSGDRSGTVAVVDMQRCRDVPEGESYVLCQEGADRTLNREGAASLSPLASRGSVGINKIVALDDQWVWTSTSSSDIHLWKDVGSRKTRVPGFRPTSAVVNEQGNEDEDSLLERTWSHSPPIPHQPTSILSPDPAQALNNRTKRLSLDHSLNRTSSRDSHSVAFVSTPPPSSSPSTSGLVLAPVAQRPPAILQNANRSVSGQTAVPTTSDFKPSLNGIPYESLVSLGQPDMPYGSYGGHFERSRFSISSAVSLPRRPLSAYLSGSSSTKPTPTQHHPELPDENAPPPGEIAVNVEEKERHARFAFEEREVVGEAVPLRSDPESVVKGRSGLVRSLMLNDRQHAITLSTAGVIAVWNIVLGTCLGLIAQEDVWEAHMQDNPTSRSLTPREALELVKERIEGEAVVPAWCTVDTKIGALGIHMEQGRCFDAEIHLDELSDRIEGHFKEDQRVSLGKLLLANLFSGFVATEVDRSRTPHTSSTPTPTTGISRSSAPTQISFAPSSFKSTGTTTPGALSALATPAMTPALAPEDSEFFTFSAPPSSQASPHHPTSSTLAKGLLPPIEQSPSLVNTPKANGGGPSSPQPELSAPAGGRDYFSPAMGRSASHKRFSSASSVDDAPLSPGQTSVDLPGGGLTPGIVTPGGSFLGKFKGLGKGKKAPAAVATPAPLVEVSEEDVQRSAEDEKYPGLSEADRYQRRVLENLFAQEVTPPNPSDIPPVTDFPDMTIFIDEESKDAGAWAVTYRGLTSTTASDVETLEMSLPTWVLEFLLTGRSFHKEPVKLSFVLEPEDKNDLAELPGGNNRLSANRSLRARKISAYVMDRLGMGMPRSRAVSLSSAAPTPKTSPKRGTARLPSSSSSHGLPSEDEPKPEDVIELLCGGVVVPPRMTLAAVKHVFRQSGDVVLTYRRKDGGVTFEY